MMNKLLLALNKFSGIDIKALLQQQAELEKNVTHLKRQLSQVLQDKETLKQRIITLEQAGTELDEALAQARGSLSDKESEFSALQAEYAALQTEQMLAANKLSTVQTKTEALQAEYDTLQKEHDSLQNEYASLQSEHVALESEYTSLQADSASLHSAYEGLNSKNSVLESDAVSLKRELESLQKQLASLQADYTSLQTERTVLQASSDMLNAEKQELESRITSLQEHLTALQTEKDSLQSEHSALVSDTDRLHTDMQQQKAAHMELKVDYDELQKRYLELSERYDKQSEDNSGLLKTQEDMQGILSSLKQDNEAMQEKITVYETELNEANERCKRLTTENDSLHTSVREHGNECKSMEENMAAKEEELKHMQGLLMQQEQSIKLLHQQIDDYKKRAGDKSAEEALAVAQSELDAYRHKFVQMETERVQQIKEISNLKESLASAQNTNDVLKQDRLNASREAEDARTVVGQLQQQLHLLKQQSEQEIAVLKKKADEKESEVEVLKQQLNNNAAMLHPGLHEKTADRQSGYELQAKPKPVGQQILRMECEGMRLVRVGENVRIGFQGVFRGHTQESEQPGQYPYTCEPVFHTEVARWNTHKQINPTLAGKFLKKGLQVLCEMDAGIQLNTQAILPVLNTEWALQPDLLLEWPEHQLCVAVLVDAPYDMNRTEPWHATDSYVDRWENYCYTNLGACVIRVAEEQLYEDYEQVLAFISNYLYEQTGDGRLMQQVAWGVSTPRWSMESARIAAMHHYRGQYLGRDMQRELLALEQDVQPVAWETLSFGFEQLPVEAVKVEALQKASAQPYVIVRTRPYASEMIFDSAQLVFHADCLEGSDLVKNQKVSLTLNEIEQIRGVSDLYKASLDMRRNRYSMDEIQAVLADAVCQYHPVKILYRTQEGYTQQTVLYWITFAPTGNPSVSLPYVALFQDLVRDAVDPETLLGMSSNHHRPVRIALRDLLQIQVMDVFVTERDGIGALVNGLYCSVLYQQAPLGDVLYGLLPDEVKAMPYARANYAHLCMLKQNFRQAKEIYTSLAPYTQLQDNMTWEDLVSNDFRELVKNDVEPDLFIRMAHELNKVGWHFE